MSKNKLYITLILLLTLAFSTRAIANLTLGTTSVTSNGALTLTTSSSTLVLPTTNGTNGQVLTTNGAGTTSWSTVGGGGGGITCSGCTMNTLPKTTGAGTLGNSSITDDGTNISTTLSSGFFQVNTTTDSRIILDSNGGSFLGTRGQLDADQVSLGDIDGALSETAIRLVSNTQTIDLIGPTAIKAQTTGTFCAGDCDTVNNGTSIFVDDTAQTINLASNNATTSAKNLSLSGYLTLVGGSGFRINGQTITFATYTVSDPGDFYIGINRNGPVTITMSASPSDGVVIIVKDEGGFAGAQTITINGNGHNIDGSAISTITTNYGSHSYRYSSTSGKWFSY